MQLFEHYCYQQELLQSCEISLNLLSKTISKIKIFPQFLFPSLLFGIFVVNRIPSVFIPKFLCYLFICSRVSLVPQCFLHSTLLIIRIQRKIEYQKKQELLGYILTCVQYLKFCLILHTNWKYFILSIYIILQFDFFQKIKYFYFIRMIIINSRINVHGSKKNSKRTSRIIKNPIEHCSARPVQQDDLFHWQGMIVGPENTPYSGGIFFLNIHFPTNYPFGPIKCNFITKIYHPYISGIGTICFANDWSPAFTISKILAYIKNLLIQPQTIRCGDHCDIFIQQLYKTNKAKFQSTARQWTKKYAT